MYDRKHFDEQKSSLLQKQFSFGSSSRSIQKNSSPFRYSPTPNSFLFKVKGPWCLLISNVLISSLLCLILPSAHLCCLFKVTSKDTLKMKSSLMRTTPTTSSVAFGLLTLGIPPSSLVASQTLPLLLLAPNGHTVAEK